MEDKMDNYRNIEEGNHQRNGNATYVIGESNRGGEGLDLTKYWSGGVCRKRFSNKNGLEEFLEHESSKCGITIVPAKIIGKRTQTLIEKWKRRYG